METSYPVADLPADLVKKIQVLEDELRQELKENIVLIAYEEEDH